MECGLAIRAFPPHPAALAAPATAASGEAAASADPAGLAVPVGARLHGDEGGGGALDDLGHQPHHRLLLVTT